MSLLKSCVLFLIVICCASCNGQNKTDLAKEGIKPGTEDITTSPVLDASKFHTQYEYSDPAGKRLIIQNSFPKGGLLYKDQHGTEYRRVVFWTRITNETTHALELQIDFSGDSYEFPSYVESSVRHRYKLILPADTMTRDKEALFDYGMTDLDSFLDNRIDKPSTLKRTINPNESSGFYVVRLFIKPEWGWQSAKKDTTRNRNPEYGTTRAGFSLSGEEIFYTLNGEEIPCGRINLKNLVLEKVLKPH